MVRGERGGVSALKYQGISKIKYIKDKFVPFPSHPLHELRSPHIKCSPANLVFFSYKKPTTKKVGLLYQLFSLPPSHIIDLPVDQLEGVDRVKQVLGGVVRDKVLGLLHSITELLQSL